MENYVENPQDLSLPTFSLFMYDLVVVLVVYLIHFSVMAAKNITTTTLGCWTSSVVGKWSRSVLSCVFDLKLRLELGSEFESSCFQSLLYSCLIFYHVSSTVGKVLYITRFPVET